MQDPQVHGLHEGRGGPDLPGQLSPDRPGGLQALHPRRRFGARGGDKLCSLRDQLVSTPPGGCGEECGDLHYGVSLHERGQRTGSHRPLPLHTLPALLGTKGQPHHSTGEGARYQSSGDQCAGGPGGPRSQDPSRFRCSPAHLNDVFQSQFHAETS